MTDRMTRANEIERQVSVLYEGTFINEMADVVLPDGRFVEVKSVLEHNSGTGRDSRAGKVRFKENQLEWLKERGAIVALVVCRSNGVRDLYEIMAQDVPGNHCSYRSLLKAGAIWKGRLRE